ncbi:MAG: hypothetical protein ACJ79L_14570, partial [Anaeromyxobacteraceae bacterium]
MTRRIASILAALAVVAPGLAAAQAPSLGTPRAPVPPYAQPQVDPHQRDSWYIGFGLGSGVGNVSGGGDTQSFHDMMRAAGVDSPITVALQFEVGATVRPDLLLGFDVRGVRSQGSTSQFGPNVDLGLQTTDYLAVATWFPAERGFFLRGGAGLAILSVDANSGSGGRVSNSYTGVGALAGLGYAFWLGQHFNLTLNLDASVQK